MCCDIYWRSSNVSKSLSLLQKGKVLNSPENMQFWQIAQPKRAPIHVCTRWWICSIHTIMCICMLYTCIHMYTIYILALVYYTHIYSCIIHRYAFMYSMYKCILSRDLLTILGMHHMNVFSYIYTYIYRYIHIYMYVYVYIIYTHM